MKRSGTLFAFAFTKGKKTCASESNNSQQQDDSEPAISADEIRTESHSDNGDCASSMQVEQDETLDSEVEVEEEPGTSSAASAEEKKKSFNSHYSVSQYVF